MPSPTPRYEETIGERLERLARDVEENLDGSVWVTTDGETVEAADRSIWLDMQWLLRHVDDLKARGGIALSLIPAAKIAKFYARCEALDV